MKYHVSIERDYHSPTTKVDFLGEFDSMQEAKNFIDGAYPTIGEWEPCCDSIYRDVEDGRQRLWIEEYLEEGEDENGH